MYVAHVYVEAIFISLKVSLPGSVTARMLWLITIRARSTIISWWLLILSWLGGIGGGDCIDCQILGDWPEFFLDGSYGTCSLFWALVTRFNKVDTFDITGPTKKNLLSYILLKQYRYITYNFNMYLRILCLISTVYKTVAFFHTKCP